MIDGKGRRRCDGMSLAGKWCGGTASWEIETDYNWLHYCDQCKPERELRPSLYFKPKAGAYWRPIRPMR
jgi:hypothetical protein